MSGTDPRDALERARHRDARATEAAAAAKLRMAEGAPGADVPFDPDEAEAAGAFRETALSEDDATEARE